MMTTILRTFILYIAVIGSVRLMGKRQIGELQPADLVITILLSEIAAIPIQDNDIPLINSLVPLMLLVGFEIISSVIGVKNVRFRILSDGNPQVVIKDGKIDQKRLKELRLTVDDLISALRQKDVFDISEVAYAVMETNGSLSVLTKPENTPITPKTANGKKQADKGFLCPLIVDGRIIETHFRDCNISIDDLRNFLRKQNLSNSKILLLTVDKNGGFDYILKEDEK